LEENPAHNGENATAAVVVRQRRVNQNADGACRSTALRPPIVGFSRFQVYIGGFEHLLDLEKGAGTCAGDAFFLSRRCEHDVDWLKWHKKQAQETALHQFVSSTMVISPSEISSSAKGERAI
jgi:hypothetical protein